MSKPRCFWVAGETGPMSIRGDPDMPQETRAALIALGDAAVRQFSGPAQPARLRPGPRASKLGRIFQASLALARKLGTDQRVRLRGGGEYVVRCRDGLITVTIKRQGAPVGDVEERTYRQHFGVPPSAQRLPAAGQQTRLDAADPGKVWYFFRLQWPDTEA